MKLSSVSYQVFMGAIMRFGYKNDLNDQHLKAISREINLDYAEMFNNERSAHAVFFHDEGFTFRASQQRFHVQSFLLVGFLLCRHESVEAQALDFWNLVNPKLDEFVERQGVVETLSLMCYVAVDLPIKYL